MSTTEKIHPGYTSDLLVAEMSAELNTAVQGLPEDGPLRVAFPLVHPDGASISYGLQALKYGDRSNVRTEVWVPRDDGRFDLITSADELRARATNLWVPSDDTASLELIRHLEERQDPLDGKVELLPGATFHGTEAMRKIVDIDLDHDSISPDNPAPPTTPVAKILFAEHIAGMPMAETVGNIAVLGYGPLVGQPLVEQVLPLKQVDMERVTVFKTKEEIEGSYERLATGEFKWVFSAYRAAAKIHDLAKGTVMIDSGYAIGEDGKPYGNAHPSLLDRSIRSDDPNPNFDNGIVVTAFRGGTGPVTIAEVFKRAAAHRQWKRDLAKIALA
ncbi:MAG TPA: hypothetical protein VLH38_01175 [Patescibacteria group bacterium]|nr:hypothetical protein [Patescibacteria group bacterium]